MKKIRVPSEMVQAAVEATCYTSLGMDEHDKLIDKALEAAFLWLSEHPQVPTDEQAEKIWNEDVTWYRSCAKPVKQIIEAWQRRCFVQEEPEIPEEEIKDLLIPVGLNFSTTDGSNQRILEAYRRGLRKGVQK